VAEEIGQYSEVHVELDVYFVRSRALPRVVGFVAGRILFGSCQEEYHSSSYSIPFYLQGIFAKEHSSLCLSIYPPTCLILLIESPCALIFRKVNLPLADRAHVVCLPMRGSNPTYADEGVLTRV
jgi:hypothetical protein